MNFSQLGLTNAQLRVCESLGYSTPTPIQIKAIPFILSGEDVIGCAETGTGKTAAFLLPIIQNLSLQARPGIRVLVLAPTRELALQIQKNYGELNHLKANRSTLVIGGANSAFLLPGNVQCGANVFVTNQLAETAAKMTPVSA